MYLDKIRNAQNMASNPKKSIWLFASAGSGKTKILTDRVIRLLLDGNDIQKILCITYTNNGANEMKARINNRLFEMTSSSLDELILILKDLTNNYPSEALINKARRLFFEINESPESIKIMTIHSFCQNLLKIFPLESNVGPRFEIIDSDASNLLIKLAKQRVFEDSLHDSKLKKIINEYYVLNGNSDNFIDKLINDRNKLDILFEASSFDDIEQYYCELICGSQDKNIIKLEDYFNNLINRFDFEALKRNIKNDFPDFLLKKPEMLDFINYRDLFKQNSSKKLAENGENKIFYNEIIKIANCHKTINLLKLAKEIMLRYNAIKMQRGVIDFNDAIIKVNKLLQSEDRDWIEYKLDGFFDHLLIDESQDTNIQQWQIVKSLANDFFSGEGRRSKMPSIFVVGDEKQSIFSFQGARPDIVKISYQYFKNKAGEQLQNISLNNSFRSTKSILEAVDALFLYEKERYGKMITKADNYHQHQSFKFNQKGLIGKVELWERVKKIKNEKNTKEEADDENDEKKLQAVEILSAVIANKISSWVGEKRKIENLEEEVKFGDIMILIKKRNDVHFLYKELRKNNVPFITNDKVDLLELLIIADLMAMLKFLLLKEDDFNLAILLKSSFFNLSDEELQEIILYKIANKINIYKALSQINHFNHIHQKLSQTLQILHSNNVITLIYFLIYQAGLAKHLMLTNNVQKLDLLEDFFLKIIKLSKDVDSLQELVANIENIRPKLEMNVANKDAVRISTIHGAKGLEAKIVIIIDDAESGKREDLHWLKIPQLSQNNQESLREDEFYLPILFTINEENIAQDNSNLSNLFNDIRNAELEERLRLTYVAMTRACNEIYFTSYEKSGRDNYTTDIHCEIQKALEQALQDNKISNFTFIKQDQLVDEYYNLNAIKERKLENTESIKYKFNEYKDDWLFTGSYQHKNNSQDDNQALVKGNLVHKILEMIGKSNSKNRALLHKLAIAIIDSQSEIEQQQKNIIKQQIVDFIDSNAFTQIFIGNEEQKIEHKIECELEVAGFINGNIMQKRIDLLIKKIAKTNNGDILQEIIIIDYKTNAIIPKNLPFQYLEQLREYRQLIENLNFEQQQFNRDKKTQASSIANDIKIKTAIFWLENLQLQFVE